MELSVPLNTNGPIPCTVKYIEMSDTMSIPAIATINSKRKASHNKNGSANKGNARCMVMVR